MISSTAKLRFYRRSPRKVRLVADMVRGKSFPEAIRNLQLSGKMAARDIEKLLRSALANMEQEHPGVDQSSVVVKRIFVDDGPRLKRGRPASKWVRWHRILKRMCHITVELALEE